MELFGINIIEHPDLPENVSWMVFRKEAPQVPQDLRDKLPLPCILTGSLEQARRTFSFLQAVSMGMRPGETVLLPSR